MTVVEKVTPEEKIEKCRMICDEMGVVFGSDRSRNNAPKNSHVYHMSLLKHPSDHISRIHAVVFLFMRSISISTIMYTQLALQKCTTQRSLVQPLPPRLRNTRKPLIFRCFSNFSHFSILQNAVCPLFRVKLRETGDGKGSPIWRKSSQISGALRFSALFIFGTILPHFRSRGRCPCLTAGCMPPR